jgi:hypothetical protein
MLMLEIINNIFPRDVSLLIYQYARQKNKSDYPYQYKYTSHFIVYHFTRYSHCYWCYKLYLETNALNTRYIEIVLIDYPPSLYSVNVINKNVKNGKYYDTGHEWGIALGDQKKLRYCLKVCQLSQMDKEESIRWIYFLDYLISLCKQDWEYIFTSRL